MTEQTTAEQAPADPQSPGSEHPPEQNKELVKVKVALDRPISDLDEAWRLATAVAFSNLLPEALRNKPSNALVLMMYGRDLGMTPMQTFNTVYVVNGKPHLGAEGWTALARKAGHKVRWLESTRDRARVQITLADDPDHPHVEEFTLDDAIAARLVTRDKDGQIIARDSSGKPKPWELYTKRMLQARALAFGMRAVAPEVALGFGIQEFGEAEYDVDQADTAGTTTVEAGQPVRQQQRPPRSPAENQADVLAAEARFRPQTITDPPTAGTADEPEAVDAEVVEDQADDQQAETPPAPATPPSSADPEADLFAGLDEQAAREMGDGDEHA